MIRAVIFDMYETLITHYECPLYFGAEMSLDAGIPEAAFQAHWRATDAARTLGQMTFEQVLTAILTENGVYSEELLAHIVRRRTATKEACFRHLHPGILPMLAGLKERGLKVGLISNCFSEEVPVIRRSVLFPYFDAACMSYEQGLRKPDPAIYRRCLEMLDAAPEECLYVGDGGSDELEAAQALGMRAVQAVWYLKEGTMQPCGRKAEFTMMEAPQDVLDLIDREQHGKLG